MNRCSCIGQDVPEEVFSHHDIELFGVAQQFHRRSVHMKMGQCNVRILPGNLGNHIAPEHHGLKNVCFVD